MDGGIRRSSNRSGDTDKKPIVVAPVQKPVSSPIVITHKKVKHQSFPIRVFKYFEPLWMGRDNRISWRAVLSMILAWKMVENFDFAVQKWEAGRPMSDVVAGLWVFAALIGGLLGFTMYQNVQADRIEAEAQNPQSPSITVQKAENVTGGQQIAEAGTVHTENIETVNTGNVKPRQIGTE